ncbi:MAG: amylo-alpha-1,6-glucosidase [Acidimicrobiia bacterium]|nr:amylo-alpha-1,6-glucosidase [Acidimicrobiia bacterium]
MSRLVDEAHSRSVDLLSAAGTEHGFVASPSFDHYAVVWARDALIASLGALATGETSLVASATATLDTLAAHASDLGQIPAVVSATRAQWDFGEGGAVDPSAWFPIVADAHLEATGDRASARRWWPVVAQSISWLRHQDVTGSGLISAAPATDWMDAALTRSGRTLHLNVLYAAAEAAADRLAQGLERPHLERDLHGTVDRWFWPVPGVDAGSLYPHGFAHDATRIAYWEAAIPGRRHYISHIVHAAFIDRCDVLANLLAIRFDIADQPKSETILDFLAEAADPHPSRTFPDPIAGSDGSGMLISVAEAVIPERWRNRPGTYHNGAAWPYVGGFHAEALARRGRIEQAWEVLERLASTNRLDDWSFPEWVDAEGTPQGARLQTWNAATFLLGYEAARAGS